MKTQWLVFTDLDGTLLDHDTYSFAAALPALHRLEEQHIPVIPVTSKTCNELLDLRTQLNNHHAFVAENGAAIYFPPDLFKVHGNGASIEPTESTSHAVLNVYRLGKPRAFWCEALDHIDARLAACFVHFTRLGDQGVAEATGLPLASARKANQREASEPLQWYGDDSALTAFTQYIESLGGQVLRGGRFLHVLDAAASKGNALRWLIAQYRLNYPHQLYQSIALGDADNDLSMLAVADQAIVIRSPYHNPPSTAAIPSAIVSQQYGPAGWNDEINTLLNHNN